MARTLGELAAQFGCELIGDPSTEVDRVSTLSDDHGGHVSFLSSSHYLDLLEKTKAAAVILRRPDAEACPVAALIAENPLLVYARVAGMLHPETAVVSGVHDSAVVANSASVADSAEISAHATIADDVVIGDNAYVGPGAFIGPRTVLGRDVRILANVTLVQDVHIGDRTMIHPGAVIGSDGFGNVQSDEGWVKLPQLGGVRIGADVEIGANSTIDRGALDDTIIEDGVRIDNLVHIAHNVRLGAHTAIAAQSGIAGSTVIGKRCMFAGQAGIVGHINICDDVIVAGKTVISKDVTKPGYYAGSFPGESHKDWKRKVARFRRLDDLAGRVTALEKKAKTDDD